MISKSTKIFWILWITGLAMIWWISYMNSQNNDERFVEHLAKNALSQDIISIQGAFAANDLDWFRMESYDDFTKWKNLGKYQKWKKVWNWFETYDDQFAYGPYTNGLRNGKRTFAYIDWTKIYVNYSKWMLDWRAIYTYKNGSKIEWYFNKNKISFWRTIWHSNWVKIWEGFDNGYSKWYRSAKYNSKLALVIDTKYTDSNKVRIYDTSSDFISKYNEASDLFNAEINIYIKAKSDTMQYISSYNNLTQTTQTTSSSQPTYTNTNTQLNNYTSTTTVAQNNNSQSNTSNQVTYTITKNSNDSYTANFSDGSSYYEYDWDTTKSYKYTSTNWIIFKNYISAWDSYSDGYIYYGDKQIWYTKFDLNTKKMTSSEIYDWVSIDIQNKLTPAATEMNNNLSVLWNWSSSQTTSSQSSNNIHTSTSLDNYKETDPKFSSKTKTISKKWFIVLADIKDWSWDGDSKFVFADLSYMTTYFYKWYEDWMESFYATNWIRIDRFYKDWKFEGKTYVYYNNDLGWTFILVDGKVSDYNLFNKTQDFAKKFQDATDQMNKQLNLVFY